MFNPEFAGRPDAPEEWSEEKFKELIKTAVELGEKTYQLAGEFEVSESTIFRWQRGKSTPMPLVRQACAERLLDILGEKFAKQITHHLVDGITSVQIEEKIQVFRDVIIGWSLGENVPEPAAQKKILHVVAELSVE